jgi:DNA-binding winged helix-turn-helix (wHTH) protein
MPAVSPEASFRFGQFEIDPASGELRRSGRKRRLQAQPFKLLVLLIRRAGAIVTYDEIRGELWGEDTYVEFDQAVHYAVRQIREALGDSADQPLYIETVPKRGYRFIAPVDAFEGSFGPRVTPIPTPTPMPATGSAPPAGRTTVRLQKALWANIAELRQAEVRQKQTQKFLVALLVVVSLALAAVLTYILL